MALPDPNDPMGFDPALEQALAEQANPYGFDWPPPEWAAAPPSNDQQIGGAMGVVENAAAPALAGGNDIEMPPENMRPVVLGQPREPGVANLLGEPTYDEPVAPSLYHDGQFEQTGMDQPAAPRLDDPTPLPDGFVGEIRPERSVSDRTLEYLQHPEKLSVDDFAAQQEADRYEQEWGQVARNRNQAAADDNYRSIVSAQNKAAADTEAIKADAVRLANTKIDGGRWYRDRSTSGKIGAWVAAIVGGLVAGRTGGPNTGLQNILKMIDDDVDAQKFDLQNQQQALGTRRSLVGEEYARSGDAFRASEAYRIASYDRELGNIKERAQQLDPRGTQARAYAKLAMGIESAKQNAIIAMTERNQKFRIGEAELEGKQLANAAALKKLAGGGVVAAPKISRAQIKADYGFDPGRDLTDKELDKLIDRKGKIGTITAQGADQERKAQDATDKANEKLVGAPGEFKNSNGKEFTARSKEEGEKLRATKSAVDLLAQMRNEISRGIEAYGGENDYFKSAEWQQQKSRQAMITAGVSKALQLGALDDGTTKLAEQLAGGVDPTSFWRDARPGLDQLVSNMSTKLNKDMNSSGYDGKPYVPPNLGKRGTVPTKSTVDKLSEGAQGKNFNERREAFFRFSGLSGLADTGVAAGDGERMQNIDALAFAADSADPRQREQAIAGLSKAASDAPTDITKQYARYMLDQVVNSKPGEYAAGVITKRSQ